MNGSAIESGLLPDAETLAWVKAEVGHFEIVSRYAHDHGYSQLWRLKAAEEHLWLKMHAFPGKWAGEVHALSRWAPGLGLAPSVVAFRPEPRSVLLTERPGFAAEKIALSPAAEERMWSMAGDWLQRLHAIENPWLGAVRADGEPWGETSHDPESFVAESFGRRIEEGRTTGLLTPREYDFTQFGLREWLPAMAGERARAVHRDFTPRNWMCGAEGELTGVIDFEHARWDVRANDMGRWWDGDFLRRPELADVFFAAYGPLDDRLRAQIRIIRLLQAASGVVWAVQVNDLRFADHNRASVHRLMAEVHWNG